MAEKAFTGLTAKVSIKPEGGTETTLAYMDGATLNLSKDIIEILQFGAQYKEKVPAIKDWSLSVSGTAAFETGGTQEMMYTAFESGELLTIGIFLDADTYFTGTGLVESLEIEAAPDDKINISMEMAGSGAVTFTLPTP